jgi:hypothetical protein
VLADLGRPLDTGISPDSLRATIGQARAQIKRRSAAYTSRWARSHSSRGRCFFAYAAHGREGIFTGNGPKGAKPHAVLYLLTQRAVIKRAMPEPERHFLPPWSVEELDSCFVVKDLNGQALAYMYFGASSPVPARAAHARRGAADRRCFCQAAGATPQARSVEELSL